MKKLKKLKAILFIMALQTLNFSFSVLATSVNPPIKNILLNQEKKSSRVMSLKDFILDRIIKNNKVSDDEIIAEYFSLPQDVMRELVLKEKASIEKIVGRNAIEAVRINLIKEKIIKAEGNYVANLITLPKEENRNKPIVIVNPGHGFEDPGASVFDPNDAEKDPAKRRKIAEKFLNQRTSASLVKMLLEDGFEVYLVFDLLDLEQNYDNLKKIITLNKLDPKNIIPKDNPSLHIVFKDRPPLMGRMEKHRMAEADQVTMRSIIDVVKSKNKDAKIISVCLHHNMTPTGNPNDISGFISFYRADKKTSKQFEENSKLLSKKLLDSCKDVYKGAGKTRIADIKTEDWLVCGFGSDNEKVEKKYVDEAAVLIELGFMNNEGTKEEKGELYSILNDEDGKSMATAIKAGIKKYFDEKFPNTKK